LFACEESRKVKFGVYGVKLGKFEGRLERDMVEWQAQMLVRKNVGDQRNSSNIKAPSATGKL